MKNAPIVNSNESALGKRNHTHDARPRRVKAMTLTRDVLFFIVRAGTAIPTEAVMLAALLALAWWHE